jgi:HEPN domain-containing protein
MKARHDQAAAYQRQAQADHSAAEQLSGSGRNSHAVVMCQQAVEKSVKALYILFGATPARTHQVSEYALRMTREPQLFQYAPDVRRELSRLFDLPTRELIRRLGELAPRSSYQDPQQTQRNTEYPFHRQGVWIAPADSTVFPNSERDEVIRTSRKIVNGVERLRAAILRQQIQG